MSTRRLDRYILREMLLPTMLGVFVFSFILMSGRALKLAELAINKGVPVAEIARLILLLLPGLLVFTLPLSFLLGLLLGFGRLAAESEITAMKASGVSLYAMLRPALLLALLASLLTGMLTLWLLPPAKHAFRDSVFQIAQQRATVGLQGGVFNRDFDGLMLYTEKLNEATGEMTDLLLVDRREAATTSLITARHGWLISRPAERRLLLRLSDGTAHRQQKGAADTYQVIRFNQYDVQLDFGPTATTEKRRQRESEMSLLQLWQHWRVTGDRSSLVALHRRLALPLSPFALLLIGMPLGLGRHRSGRGAGFSMALLLFLGYYLLLSLGSTLAEAGLAPILPAMWAPNLLFLAVGLWLFRRAAEERPLLPPLPWSRRKEAA